MASHSPLCSQKAAPAMGMVAELQAKLQKNRNVPTPAKVPVKEGVVDVSAPIAVKVSKLPPSVGPAVIAREDNSPTATSRKFCVASPPASPSNFSRSKSPAPGERDGRRPYPSNLKTELRKTTSNVTLGGNNQGNDNCDGSLAKPTLLTRRSIGGGGGKELTTLCSQEGDQSGLTVVLELPSPSSGSAFGYQNVFDNPQTQKPNASPSTRDKDVTPAKQKKPIPIPRKGSTTDTQALCGGGPAEEPDQSGSRDTPPGARDTPPPGAALQSSKSLNDLDECSATSDAPVRAPLRRDIACLYRSAEDVLCSNSRGSPGAQVPPTKPLPLPVRGKIVLTKTTSHCSAHSGDDTPTEVRNRACSEGDLIVATSPLDDDYIHMDPTTSSGRTSAYYLEVLPSEGDTLNSPDNMYMDMNLEVFGKAGTPPGDAYPSEVGGGRAVAPLQPGTPRDQSAGSDHLSSRGEEQGRGMDGGGGGGGANPPVVPKRPPVSTSDCSSGSTSSDEYIYTTIPSKKWLVSPQTPDHSSKDAPPRAKREMVSMKPPDPPPKSKSLLREQGVLLTANNKKPGDLNNKLTAATADPIAKEVAKKERVPPRVEPYSSRGSKPTSPVKAVITKTPASPQVETADQNAKVLHHTPVRLVSQSSESDFESTNAWGLKRALPPRPPPLRGSRTRVYDQTLLDGRPIDNGREPQEPKDGKGGRLPSKLDRTSLLVIMENREAISKRLGLGLCDPKNGGENTVDMLGRILVQIDSLIDSKLYSEQELIKTIETYLNIRLTPLMTEERGKEVEGVALGKGTGLILTDQDVERVNQLVRSSCFEDDFESELVRSGVKDEGEVEEKVSHRSSDSDCEYVSSIIMGGGHPQPITSPDVRKPHSRSLSNLEVSQVRMGGGADRRPSTLADDVINTTFSWDSGCGTFSDKGGLLTKSGSGVRVDIPQGAITRDKRQQIWFELKDPFVLEDPADATCPLRHESPALCITRGDEVESHFRSKADAHHVQLSPTVEVGPGDAVIFSALQVTIPHCLSLQSLGWNIHVEGQVGPSGEWLRLPKSHTNMLSCKSKAGLFWNSSYQLHMNHVTIHTTQLGSFRLVGCPMMKGVRSGKKMLASVYTKGSQSIEEGNSCVPVTVFIINNIQDHSEVSAVPCCVGQQTM